MWNLEKWYRWSYLQNKNRDTEVGEKHLDMKRKSWGMGGMNWEVGIDIFTLLMLCIKQITNEYCTGIAQGVLSSAL